MAAHRLSVALLALTALTACGHKTRPGVGADLAAVVDQIVARDAQ